jgi:hypothetical protein
MQNLQRPAGPRPPAIDWNLPVVDLADQWPFKETIVDLKDSCYIDDAGRIIDAATQHDYALDKGGQDTVLGHLTDGRMFVSSREGITAFEAK